MAEQLLEHVCPNCDTSYYFRRGDVGEVVACSGCKRRFELLDPPPSDDDCEIALADDFTSSSGPDDEPEALPSHSGLPGVDSKVQSPSKNSFAWKLFKTASKAFLVAVASALGAKFGGWLCAAIVMAISSTLVVAASDGLGEGQHDQSSH